jgi:aspartate/methionine/tyrosine aminotransferase
LSSAPFKLDANASSESLNSAYEQLHAQHQKFIADGLSLDLTRGKPSTKQLDLSNALLASTPEDFLDSAIDLRNYGVLDGLPKAKQLFGTLLGVDEETAEQRVFVGGNSSLSLMHYTLWFAHHLGLHAKQQAWRKESDESGEHIKMLCPCPGYDRHFSVCEQLGVEMIPVPLTGAGPDMDIVEALIKADPNIKGIWCVPRFSNPTGEVYSAATVARLAELPKHASKNFYVLWDNAYSLHAFTDQAPSLASIEHAAEAAGTLDQIIQFGSTSKMTFAGAGIGYMASSEQTIAAFRKQFAMASIGSDKLNQQRHINFLSDLASTKDHMALHAEIMAPKFEAVAKALHDHFDDSDLGVWSNPQGGYFVSFDTRPGLAKKVVALAAEAGVKLTPAGATFPNGYDPEDKNIRLAPSFPEIGEVNKAMQVFVNCVKLASVEQAMQQ